MKKFLSIACFFFFAVHGIGQAVKKLKIEELESYIKTSDHPVVLSFWATWCAPCIHEIPWLQAAIEKQRDQKVEYVLVSLDFPDAYPKKIAGFAKQMNFTATLFWLDETNADHFCPKIDEKWSGGIPANLFINNKTGYRKFIGRQLTDRQAIVETELLVKEQ
jgi:thiol-disulfide isomerase/thioredoxin